MWPCTFWFCKNPIKKPKKQNPSCDILKLPCICYYNPYWGIYIVALKTGIYLANNLVLYLISKPVRNATVRVHAREIINPKTITPRSSPLVPLLTVRPQPACGKGERWGDDFHMPSSYSYISTFVIHSKQSFCSCDDRSPVDTPCERPPCPNPNHIYEKMHVC